MQESTELPAGLSPKQQPTVRTENQLCKKKKKEFFYCESFSIQLLIMIKPFIVKIRKTVSFFKRYFQQSSRS